MATVDRLRITRADHGRPMTLEEFREVEEEEGFRFELARGALEVSEVPNDPHGFVIFQLVSALMAFHHRHPDRIWRSGEASGFRLWLPGMISARHPDYAVVLRGTPKNHRGRRMPSLVVEVVSPGNEARTRDYVTKREEYLAFGILEYWIIDPSEHKVTVLTRDGDVWNEAIFNDGQTASGLVLPGFVVPVDGLWIMPEDQDETPDEED